MLNTEAPPITDFPMLDPIGAASDWLHDVDNRARVRADVLEQAERTLDVARQHYRELDMLAGAVALDANETGQVDQRRLDQVDEMASVLHTYSLRLRDLVDRAANAPDEVASSLAAGLDAAEAGGLRALLHAI